MIQYSKITLKGLIDEVLIRLGDHRSDINLDWKTLVNYVNHSVKEVSSLVMPYDGQSFLRRIEDIENGDSIPREFVRTSRLLVEKEAGVFYEARDVDIKEYFSVTNSVNIHDFNHSYDYAGIYTFWGQADTGADPIDFRIYIYPDDLTGILDYYSMPAEITQDNDVVPLPEEYIEMVVYGTMQRVYARTTQHAQIMEIQRRLAAEKMKIMELYVAKRETEKRELDSFVEPVVPFIPSKPTEGEVPKRL